MNAGSGRRRKQDEIREAVTAYILENSLPAGSPLPTEVELMERLGVGRNALREAMKVLDALGIVEIRHGFGTFVGDSAFSALENGLAFRAANSLQGDGSEIRNLLEVREALEVGLASRVIATGDTTHLDELDGIVAEMDASAARGEYFPALDWRFHETLYRPLGNDLVVELLRIFWQVFASADVQLPGPRYTPAEAAGWHRSIVDALRGGDDETARAAMTDHFGGIRQRLDSPTSD